MLAAVKVLRKHSWDNSETWNLCSTKLGKIDVCGCGAYNYNETDKVEEPCYNCGKTVKWWNKKVDEKYLQSQFDSRRKAEKEKELEKQRIEEEQRAIKK